MAAFGGRRITRTGIIFIVGILVLGGLVTGGIFLVKNHGEAVRREEAVKIAEQNLKDQSKVVVTQPVNDTGAENSDKAGTGTGAGTSTANPATTGSTSGQSALATATGELPVTGIDDLRFVGQATVLALLAFSVVSYVASRRAADQL